MAFVQLFEVADNPNLPMDEIDAVLRCVRLKWQQRSGWVGELSSAIEYGLTPLRSVRGFVHLIRRDFAFEVLDTSHPRKIIAEQLYEGKGGWPSDLFKVNGFFNMQIDE